MKLVIAEYLRSLRERDELDRLLPELLIEMGYVPVTRAQTGNRQYGVDIAARSVRKKGGVSELLLLVVKQGDIGRTEWDGSDQAVRQSINEIFDVYLRSHLEPADKNRAIRIIVVTGGDLKSTVRGSWSGFVTENEKRARIEFWGADELAVLMEQHLLNEHVFLEEDRRDLRRALALSGDSEYERSDLHTLFLRVLGLTGEGLLELSTKAKSTKELLKSFRVLNLSAQTFAHWTMLGDADARQGMFAMERALLWSWHRLRLLDEKARRAVITGPFARLLEGYRRTALQYFSKIQPHCFVESALSKYASNGIESSLIAFETIGILASMALFLSCKLPSDVELAKDEHRDANRIVEALVAWIENNGPCSSPCLDRHSQDISFGMLALLKFGERDAAVRWLQKIFRNVDYAYASRRYVPASMDSMDDLVDEGGWLGEKATDRMMEMSWTLATIAGWSIILGLDDMYSALQSSAKENYPQVFMQLWHAEEDLYERLYFKRADHDSGATEAPIHLPSSADEYRAQMRLVLTSDFGKVPSHSPAAGAGFPSLDWIAYRHFSTPVTPAIWYSVLQASGNGCG